MRLAAITFIGFDGISDGEINLSAGGPAVIVGAPASGKSRLAKAISGVIDELYGRSRSHELLRGERGKVVIRWAFSDDDLAYVSRPEDAVSEILVGTHPELAARADRDVGLVLARKHRISAVSLDAASFGRLAEGAQDQVVVHLLGVERSEAAERWMALASVVAPVEVGTVRRVGRRYEPEMVLSGRKRTFDELPRTYRVALALAASVTLTTSALVLIDDADLVPTKLLEQCAAACGSRQLVLFAQNQLAGWPTHLL